MFSRILRSTSRVLLFPFSMLYWLVIAIRNFLYDKNIFKSTSFGLPVICVGNLSVGGTGKTPMVEWLVSHFRDRFKLVILSRGYKRKTRDYTLANHETTALEIGDEPQIFHQKFPEVPVAVGEKRIEAIPQILHDKPETEAIILDDAFQHRAIRAGLNILLTDYSHLFTRSFYLPAGNLRDLKSRAKQAEIIVVSKCPFTLGREEKLEIIREIKPRETQPVFFTSIQYGDPYHIYSKEVLPLSENKEILLVTGIANPEPLKKLLEEKTKAYYLMQFPDHHIFSVDELNTIKIRFNRIGESQKMILTTEKDAVRLEKFRPAIEQLALYVIPMQIQFLFDEKQQFEELIANFIRDFRAVKN